MRYTHIKEDAKTGTEKFVDGVTYVKRKNGKWQIKPTPQIRDWLKSLYQVKGLNMRELSNETGIPHGSLQKLLHHFDLMRSKKKKAASHIDIVVSERDTIIEWNKKLVSPGKMASRLAHKHSTDMCVWAFKTACNRAGTPLMSRSQVKQAFLRRNKSSICRMYVEDKRSASYIVDGIRKKFPHMRITSGALKDFLRANGVRVRTHEEAVSLLEDNRAKGRTCEVNQNRNAARQSWTYKLSLDPSLLTYKEYRRLISTVTRSAMKRFPAHYAHVLNVGPGESIDHIVSVHDAYFRLNRDTMEYERRPSVIPVRFMVHPCNLQVLPDRTNRMKGVASWMTLKELKNSVNKSDFKLEAG